MGTSYVNELDSQRALSNLKAWVQHNPKYAGLEIALDEYSDGTLMDEVSVLCAEFVLSAGGGAVSLRCLSWSPCVVL